MRATRRDWEARLAASERKVYALTKEREALKRGQDKMSGLDDLLKEKDAIIKQVGARAGVRACVGSVRRGVGGWAASLL